MTKIINLDELEPLDIHDRDITLLMNWYKLDYYTIISISKASRNILYQNMIECKRIEEKDK